MVDAPMVCCPYQIFVLKNGRECCSLGHELVRGKVGTALWYCQRCHTMIGESGKMQEFIPRGCVVFDEDSYHEALREARMNMVMAEQQHTFLLSVGSPPSAYAEVMETLLAFQRSLCDAICAYERENSLPSAIDAKHGEWMSAVAKEMGA